VKTVLGSHKFIRRIFEREGHPLVPLPFRGAIYRVGHGQNISQAAGLRHEFFSRGLLRREPLEFVRRFGRLRLVTASIRKEVLAGGMM
jgi:hypothetical protein